VEAKGKVIGDRWEPSSNSVLAKKFQVRGAVPNFVCLWSYLLSVLIFMRWISC